MGYKVWGAEIIASVTVQTQGKRMTVFDEGQQQFWREHGYMVVRDVVPAPLLEAVKQNIEEFLGKDLSDPDDWYKEPM